MIFEPFRDRENVEWTNTWIEACSNPNKPRILIVGDSVARDIRSEMSKSYPNCAIDFIGSSSSFEDPCFYNILDAFFLNNLYCYQAVLCNIGAKHGWYLCTNSNANHAQRYRKAFEKFVNYLYKKCGNLFLLTTTPNKIATDIATWDEIKNVEIRKRNDIQSQVFKKRGHPVLDLYSFVMKKQYAYKDHCHFMDRSASQEIAAYIMRKLGNQRKTVYTNYALLGFIPLLSVEEK